MRASFVICLLLLVSAAAAVELSEDSFSDNEFFDANELSEADSEILSDDEVEANELSEADAEMLSDEEVESLQEEFKIYGKYCGPSEFTPLFHSTFCDSLPFVYSYKQLIRRDTLLLCRLVRWQKSRRRTEVQLERETQR
jgi:hypothetical protein